jgi:hypothetical protein
MSGEFTEQGEISVYHNNHMVRVYLLVNFTLHQICTSSFLSGSQLSFPAKFNPENSPRSINVDS